MRLRPANSQRSMCTKEDFQSWSIDLAPQSGPSKKKGLNVVEVTNYKIEALYKWQQELQLLLKV